MILVGYLLPVPAIIVTIGWILLVIGVVLFILARSVARSADADTGTDPRPLSQARYCVAPVGITL